MGLFPQSKKTKTFQCLVTSEILEMYWNNLARLLYSTSVCTVVSKHTSELSSFRSQGLINADPQMVQHQDLPFPGSLPLMSITHIPPPLCALLSSFGGYFDGLMIGLALYSQLFLKPCCTTYCYCTDPSSLNIISSHTHIEQREEPGYEVWPEVSCETELTCIMSASLVQM